MSKEAREDVEKWIAARRQNYPTKTNIQKKEELKARGLPQFHETAPVLSNLEHKLRKKLTFILSEIEGPRKPKREPRPPRPTQQQPDGFGQKGQENR